MLDDDRVLGLSPTDLPSHDELTLTMQDAAPGHQFEGFFHDSLTRQR